ncbi:MAG: Stp1/IreP family PP2C-type Ser/Thr phosphatase, partial [Clostridia bacterium]
GLSDEILQQRGHLFAVADGMGGHAAGEVASNQAISTLFTEYYTGEWIDPQTTLAAAIEAANRTIFEMAEANDAMSGMGTTLVAALYRDETWLIAHVGDSRAYLFRDGKLKQLTQDHSWVAEQMNSGILSQDEAAHHPFRNVITRALGNEPEVTPDILTETAQPGEILLLCSDGLSNMVSEADMTGILKAYPLDDAANMLLELALERGAPDNITQVLVQLMGKKPRPSRSKLPWLALLTALILIAAFVYLTYFAQPTPPIPTTQPAVALATLTPTPTVTPTLAATPTFSSTAPAPSPNITPTTPERIKPTTGRTTDATFTPEVTPPLITGDPITPTSSSTAPTLIYVQGPATIQTLNGSLAVTITHVGKDGLAHSYQSILPKNALSEHPIRSGSFLGMLGYAATGARKQEAAISPVLLLSPTNSPDFLPVLWQQEADFNQLEGKPVQLYTISGQGGGESLGFATAPGTEGDVLVVNGKWHLATDQLAQFTQIP